MSYDFKYPKAILGEKQVDMNRPLTFFNHYSLSQLLTNSLKDPWHEFNCNENSYNDVVGCLED